MLNEALIARINNNPEMLAAVLATVEKFGVGDSFEDRLEGLGLRLPDEGRNETLRVAHEAGVSDEDLLRIAGSIRVSRGPTIEVPLKYGHTSRAKSWARLGSGDYVEWGEIDGSRATLHDEGEWVVFSSDGFKRQKKTTWKVEHVQVGDQTWTIAS